MQKKTEPFIIAKDLSLAYDDRFVVQDANFTVNRGDIFIIMGLSGSGKSTIMRSMIGLMPPKHGAVFIDGVDIWAADTNVRSEIIGRFGVSFQSGALFSSMTVGENIALPLELKSDLSSTKIRQSVNEKLKIVGLCGCENLYPSELSGGMAKRAALARALINEPDVLFFDEPSAGLDPVHNAELNKLIMDINTGFGTTIIMVTHDLATIMSIATNAVYLDNKKVISIGNPKKAINTIKNPQVIKFFYADQGGKK